MNKNTFSSNVQGFKKWVGTFITLLLSNMLFHYVDTQKFETGSRLAKTQNLNPDCKSKKQKAERFA